MELQKVFDKMVDHLRHQGARSVDEVGDCQYRGKDGMKCAVGCLIPDELYRVEMEGKSAETLAHQFPELGWRRDADFSYLIRRMQYIHDYYENWELQFECAAEDFNLKYFPN